MKEINVLTKLSQGGLLQTQIRGFTEFKQGKELKLFKNSSGKYYPDDFTASQDLYNADPNDVRYKMLKVRVKRKLYNSLFFLDYDQLRINSIHRAELECLKLLHHAHVLLRVYELDLTLQNIAKVKKIASKYEFINILIYAVEIELNCYTENGNFREYKACKKLLDSLIKTKFYEREALSIYQSIKLDAKRAVRLRKDQLISNNKNAFRLQKMYLKANTFEAFNSYYKGSIIYYEMVGNFDAIVDLTVDAEKKVEEGIINPLRFNRAFNKFELVYSHLRAKKLESGIKYAADYIDKFTEFTPNWYAFLENYVLLALHSEKYELATSLMSKAFSSSNINKLPAAAQERWNLYEAYCLLMSNKEHESLAKKNPFLLSLPEYSKDKQGFNVAILILQFVYYLQKRDTEALLYRIESLKKYMLTHLKDNFSLRSKTFLRMLILIVTEDYDVVSCRKKGEKLYQKLMDTPTPGDAFAEIEIVPYEHLWMHILDTLQAHYE